VTDESTYYTPRRLAKHLRDARKRAEVSQAEMAEKMHRTQSWVSLIERGQISVTTDFLEKWCDALDLSAEERQTLNDGYSRESDSYLEWRRLWAAGVDDVQRERGELEKNAKRVRIFQSSFVHSLLQTPQYTESIYHATRFFPDDSQMPRFLQGRLARQAILHAPDKQIDALLTEAAVRSMIAPPDTMALQMEHLIKLSERQMVNLAILPFSKPLMVLPHNNWDIFDDSVAVVELVSGQVTFSEASELALYTETFELLWEDALHDDEAREFLWSIARSYEHRSDDA
jgi:transcriptional regulator with XRE-family HTH domain